ncbi:MFS transporter [Tumebacillus sp. ITR2]|uniref:MFS transporter n=1 Tax=Tumebacillus amylolyticus TaxID=2801339 RepID=A0ABS1JFU3_9BACL|nr:MFS transporter [Tumebacillus amylolyticus]MBL0389146.1 MFS transporter [Tumebacillus amylolyticus]
MRRAVLILCLAVFVLVMGTGMVAPLLASYARAMGATGVGVGLLYSCFYIVRLLVGTSVGTWADRRGPKVVLTASMLLYPLIAAAYWVSDHYFLLMGTRLLHGLASAMLLPMAMAYIGEVSPAGREGKYMGFYNTTVFAANGAGPLVGSWVMENWGIGAAFCFLFVLALGSIGIVFALPSRTGGGINVEKKSTLPSCAPWRNSGLLALAAIQVQLGVLTVFWVSFFPLFMESIGVRPFWSGALIALNGLIVGLLQIPLGRVVDRVSKSWWVWGSGLLTAAAVMLISESTSLGAIAGLVVVVAGASALTLASASALSTVWGRKNGMGSTMGFLGSASSLGMIIGPLVSGFLLDTFEIASTVWFTSLVWLTCSLGFASMWQRRTEVECFFQSREM